ncbi:hypothetical protein CGLO_11974 [Colletotrichum gloeosporioides Cg-14]|uniref:Uncharacterized protein n=1 Tax=Colletotrichum gloeosporioides (strain Cg-14) TaxID=1237896 RepID=T0LAM2_COLGC|nr:hypothetical protein CGLO_11974 [Colletotrichum gloeosporioides Cg-14]
MATKYIRGGLDNYWQLVTGFARSVVNRRRRLRGTQKGSKRLWIVLAETCADPYPVAEREDASPEMVVRLFQATVSKSGVEARKQHARREREQSAYR